MKRNHDFTLKDIMTLAAMAQQASDNSVNISFTANLGEYGPNWSISCERWIFDESGNKSLIQKSEMISPITENYIERLTEISENGYK